MARFASYDGTQIGLDRMDLLGHSAAGNLAVLYAAAAAAARLFPDATVTVQPGAAHFPWLDDPAFFIAAVTSFLS